MKTLIALAAGVGLGVYANRKYNEAKQRLTPQQMAAHSAKFAGKAAVSAAKTAGKAAAGAAKSYMAHRQEANTANAASSVNAFNSADGAHATTAASGKNSGATFKAGSRPKVDPSAVPESARVAEPAAQGGFSFKAPSPPKPAPRLGKTGAADTQGVPGYKASGFPE